MNGKRHTPEQITANPTRLRQVPRGEENLRPIL